MAKTTKYKWDKQKLSATPDVCEIFVTTDDMFELAQRTENSVIHNFANNFHQGGPSSKFAEDGVYISHNDRSKTQEDQLVMLYRNNITFPKAMYPICREGEICLLYHECTGGLPPVITIPAPVDPRESDRDDILHRIMLILRVASREKKSLVTGLWGCGVFGADPEFMADIWYEAISKSRERPSKIYFCIFIDRASQKWKDPLRTFEKMKRRLSS
jgi:Poly (ADP-ribose) glycohydrolase (PARG)